MEKVEAPTLEEAYKKVANQLSCSISDIDYEVIQYPKKGIIGLFKKSAIIVAVKKEQKRVVKKPIEKKNIKIVEKSEEKSLEVDNEFENKDTNREIKWKKRNYNEYEDSAVLDTFFDGKQTKPYVKEKQENVRDEKLSLEIEDKLKSLFESSCFDIDVVEVDVIGKVALIFIDGNDAALLIGKEGYRYNALTYMLFNWLQSKYELSIKLEIAAFITSQEEMIKHYIKPVIETVEKQGKGKTKFLDGILVQIALEQLRARFPTKYVAIKQGKEGKKFVLVNEFKSKRVHV